jgi:hypothetical protein
MYYIGLDVHKKTISYCVKDTGGQIHREGTIGASRNELDWWIKTLPQPWTALDLRSSAPTCGSGVRFCQRQELSPRGTHCGLWILKAFDFARSSVARRENLVFS